MQPIEPSQGVGRRTAIRTGAALGLGALADGLLRPDEAAANAFAVLGNDGYVGDPGGSRLSLSVAIVDTGSGPTTIGGQTYNTGAFLQSMAGANLSSGASIPNQAKPIGVAQYTTADYLDGGSGQIFHEAISVSNTGTRTTVALFSQATGQHVFAANFVGYANGDDGASAVGLEIDGGNLSSSNRAAGVTLLDLVSDGGHAGGLNGVGTFLQIGTNDALSQLAHGIKFNAGTFQPIGTQAGTTIQGMLHGTNQITSVSPTTGYANNNYVVGQGIPAGTTIVSGAGTSTLIISAPATDTGPIGDGGGFVFASGTGSLISAGGSNVAFGIDFESATFSTAAIQFCDGNNLKFGTSIGTKIGTGTGQKLGFWNATPVKRPTAGNITSGYTAGSGTPVTIDGKTTGNVGSTGYTAGDVVAALKNIGLLSS